jgi:hypothetical protein
MNLVKAKAQAVKALQRAKDRMVRVFNKTRKPSPEYEVELIELKQVRQGKVWYLVNWRGYGHEDDTWELVANLANAR